MSSTHILTVEVHRVTRRKNSANGNPCKVLHTDLGRFITSPDAMCAFAISDNFTGTAILTLTPAQRVVGFNALHA